MEVEANVGLLELLLHEQGHHDQLIIMYPDGLYLAIISARFVQLVLDIDDLVGKPLI